MSTESFNALPPAPKPPHDPTWLSLDFANGWQMMPDVAIAGAGPAAEAKDCIQLPAKPMNCIQRFGPKNVAHGPNDHVFLLDCERQRLKRFDPCTCQFLTIPHIGGLDLDDTRAFCDACAIALCGERLLVADAGKERVAVFSIHGYSLLDELRPPRAEFSRYVVDDRLIQNLKSLLAADALVDRFSALLSERPLHERVFESSLALEEAVSVGIEEMIEPYRHWLAAASRRLWKPVALQVIKGRGIFVKDALHNRVHHFSAAGQWQGSSELEPGFDFSGKSTCMPPPPYFVHWKGEHLNFEPLCQDKEDTWFDLNGIPTEPPGDASPPMYESKAEFVTQALDSRIYQCQWHRVTIEGRLPPDTSVEVLTYTSQIDTEDASQLENLPDDAWETRQVFRGRDRSARECLIRNTGGRYLWLRLRLTGTGFASPSLESITIEFPRVSLSRYLPAVFRQDPLAANFTDRFLSIFDTGLRSIEQPIDLLTRFFDPDAAPVARGRDFLSWLETWIGISGTRGWPESKRRAYLKRAAKWFRTRGTRKSLHEILTFYLGMDKAALASADCRSVDPDECPRILSPCEKYTRQAPEWQPPPLILEHFHLRRWLYLGAGKLGDNTRLWGERIANRSRLGETAQAGQSLLRSSQDPLRDSFHIYAHRFSVFVPECWGKDEQRRRGLEQLLASESPAHTVYCIEYVPTRGRIGVRSMIGYDAVVGTYPDDGITLNESSPLGRATILGAAPDDPPRLGKRSRLGTDARLN